MSYTKTVLTAVCAFAALSASAQVFYEESETVILTPVKHEQRIQNRRIAAQQTGNCPFEEMWSNGKNTANEIGLDIGADISYLAQRVSPNGKQTAIQGIYYPYLTWNLFQDRALGSGQLNVNYTLIRYWGTQATDLQTRANLATPVNDYAANQEFFSQFSFTHTLPGAMNWLSLTVGQYPLYNFDGTTYLDNQQTALMNFALSQNATAAYPLASFGGYLQAQNKSFTLTAGYQDATNISGQNIKLDTAFDGKYTLFGSLAWTPHFGLGNGQYSMLYYYQPAVKEQNEDINGWSFNMQQNIGTKWAMFGRANGVNHSVTGVRNSFALGGALLDPFERNSQDAILLGMAYNRLSKTPFGNASYMRDAETAVELQWIWGIGKLVTITPDLQIYPRAGLTDKKQFTTVVGLRTTVQL
jgi:hypothetical protein